MAEEFTGGIVLDLTQVQDELIAQGAHEVEVEDVWVRQGKAGPYIALQTTLTDAGDPQYGRKLFWNLQLQGGGMVFTRRCLAAMGFDVEQPISWPDRDAVAQDLVGRRVIAHVKHKNRDGETSVEVNKWAPCSGL